jgi:SAM-dependent methyltransferase
MNGTVNPARYEAWYHTPRGRWIGDTEFGLLMQLLQPPAGASLLDAGSGTGYFSRRFAGAGLTVTGLDPDPAAIAYAREQDASVSYLQGTMTALPFADGSYDYCAAVTSLCFVPEPAAALRELWRVCRHGVVLGLLNRQSLLYHRKHGRGGYRGARWDNTPRVRAWARDLSPSPRDLQLRNAIFLPGGSRMAQLIERVLPASVPVGGFLAVHIRK